MMPSLFAGTANLYTHRTRERDKQFDNKCTLIRERARHNVQSSLSAHTLCFALLCRIVHKWQTANLQYCVVVICVLRYERIAYYLCQRRKFPTTL